MDTDIGTELFAGYENDFKLIIADISSKLQDLQDQDGESRKAAVRAAERAAEEAEEIVPHRGRATLTLNVDRPNGDGSHEYTNSSTS
jgi:vesicle transport through interaction with t-SNAREs protein 1